jgi:hypothetical protein
VPLFTVRLRELLLIVPSVAVTTTVPEFVIVRVLPVTVAGDPYGY